MPYGSTSALPKQVKVLPAAAQKIWMAAFNAAYQKNGEEAAMRIAWAAVKQKYKKSVTGTWVAKSGDEASVIDGLDMVEDMMFDAGNLRFTDEGYLLATPRIARTGIQVYTADEMGVDPKRYKDGVVRVYRPEGEVFHIDALRRLANKPVTLDHPPDQVDATTWREYAIGQIGGEVARDGDFIRVPMMVMDQKAIDAVRSGKAQLSVGYSADIKWGEGTTPEGLVYDAMQTSIRANHVAVVGMARGGSKLKIGDHRQEGPAERSQLMQVLDVNGIRVELEDKDASIIQAHIRSLNDQLAAANATAKKTKDESDAQVVTLQTQAAKDAETIKGKDVEIATLKTKLEESKVTPQQLDEAVKRRGEIIAKAKAVLGDKLVVDGKTDVEIMRQVIDTKPHLKDLSKDWSDEHVRISFASLVADIKADDKGGGGVTHKDVAASFSGPGAPATGPAAEAWATMVDSVSNAWKGKAN